MQLLLDGKPSVRYRHGLNYRDLKLPKQKEVPMIRSTVFIVDHSQAVRLPKDVAFPEGVYEVEIIKIGESRLVCPVG
jgi:hypothetical protein